MAKRYIRVNWQNKPSTATPWSAANLNIMDKGINDCDDAIELKIDKTSIANNAITTAAGLVLDARQGKSLQDQITEQNNNLGNNVKIRYGAILATFTNGLYTATINGFTSLPLVLAQFASNGVQVITATEAINNTTVKIYSKNTTDGSAYSGTVYIVYIAIGT